METEPILTETFASIKDILGAELDRITVERAVVGLFFTGVKLDTGVTGASATPLRSISDALAMPFSGKLRGRLARDLLTETAATDTTSRSKKVLQAAERQRADVARARRRWIREQGMLDPARLVFIDETAVSTNMVRLRGRAPRGVRVIGAVPLGRWQTITFVAALRYNKMVAPMVVEGAMTGACRGPSAARHWPGYRNSGRDTALPAEIFARPQSHRYALQQIQDIPV